MDDGALEHGVDSRQALNVAAAATQTQGTQVNLQPTPLEQAVGLPPTEKRLQMRNGSICETQ